MTSRMPSRATSEPALLTRMSIGAVIASTARVDQRADFIGLPHVGRQGDRVAAGRDDALARRLGAAGLL